MLLGRARFSILERQPYPLSFVTVSGAHLYGFPSEDSDFDLRGVHVTPPQTLLSLQPPRETIEDQSTEDGPLDELVTHDARKYAQLLLRNNGYVLEQIFSPLVVIEGDLPRWRALAQQCIARKHVQHYLGFARSEWTQFHRRPEKTVKRLLYVIRVMLTGIHLLRTGEVEANLLALNEAYQLPYVPELVAAKRANGEAAQLPPDKQLPFYEREYARLETLLKEAHEQSTLPDETPGAREALDAFLRELRFSRPQAL
ncbi:MAG: nucleotidyltransferase domain-containing protein [Candidatus Eremiobacteraeota bacterium]|nr:nucleotidyltransferase domain-containing protein [Candidatus Eremiobacteraeota bacterium]